MSSLYEICFSKHISVADVVLNRGARVCFRRTLWGDLFADRQKILELCDKVRLSACDDRIRWSLSRNGRFIVSSFYKHLMWRNVVFPQKFMCGKSKFHRKLEYFCGL